MRINKDATITGKTGSACEFLVGKDASGEDEHIAMKRIRDAACRKKTQRVHGILRVVRVDFDDLRIEKNFDATVADFFEEQIRGGMIKLFSHETVRTLNKRDAAAERAKGTGEFEA
jgi:hypothetical protein